MIIIDAHAIDSPEDFVIDLWEWVEKFEGGKYAAVIISINTEDVDWLKRGQIDVSEEM